MVQSLAVILAHTLTRGCSSIGAGGCVTYVMPGGVPFSSVDCGATPGIVSVQTTYAGGPVSQQIPMAYDQYLISATSTLCSLSIITSGCPTPTSSPDSSSKAANWVHNHEGLVIGLAIAVAVLLMLGCCIRCFWPRRRKVFVEVPREESFAMPIQHTYVVAPKQNY